jgi:TonB family protein
MKRRFCLPVLFTCAVLVLGSAGGRRVQGQSPVAKTPGELAVHAASLRPLPDAVLRTALTDSRPAMRLTAARIAGVVHAVSATADIARALEREPHAEAALEQLRSLLLFRTTESLAAAETSAKRVRGAPLMAWASWLARTAPERLAEQIVHLADLDDPGAVLDIAWRHHPSARQMLVSAWLQRAGTAWDRLLPHLLHPQTAAADAPMVVEALRAGDAAVRERIVWLVLHRVSDRKAVPEDVLRAASTLNAARADAPAWEDVGREWLARWHRKTKTPDRSAVLSARAGTHARDLETVRALGVLTNSEIQALRQALGDGRDHQRHSRSDSPPAELPPAPVARTPAPLFPGFLASLLAAAGCPMTDDDSFLAVNLTYDADGRPIRANMHPASKGCQAAVAGLVQVTLADDRYVIRDRHTDWLVLFLGRDRVACADGAQPAHTLATLGPSDEQRVQAPRLISSVKPKYPTAELSAQATGEVVIAGRVSTDGCVSRAAVVRSSGPYTTPDTSTAFALAALQAVVQWRYSPAVLDGVGVPVDLTVNVVFTLR